MNHQFLDLMRAATRLTNTSRLTEAARAVKRALALHGAPASSAAGAPPLKRHGGLFAPAARPSIAPRSGEAFIDGMHTHGSLKRAYKLFVPPNAVGRRLPLVVMLHGCTQDPDDFAAGTGMNARARDQGFYVLYPAQSLDANPSRCWNWFKHTHQRRGSGEAGLIADLTGAIVRRHGIDSQRVYIAGLSAGGAMAAIVAATHPEIYAAVGVHSGLAVGAASDLGEALNAMRSGAAPAAPTPTVVPTIVFHGDEDTTVHPRNGEHLISAAALASSASQVEPGVSAGGRHYTRQTYQGEHGRAVAEHWLVHGAGHAWSGGHSAGSYTDAKGPDATAEMLRFFFAQTSHRPAGAHA